MSAMHTSPGDTAGTIVNEAVVECFRLLLVPVTFTLNVPVGPPANEVKVRVADPVPPEESVTLVGLMLQPGQLGHVRFGEVPRLTVPLNPFTLVKAMLDVAEEPCCTFCVDGDADIEKSGDGGAVTVKDSPTECFRVPLVPLTIAL